MRGAIMHTYCLDWFKEVPTRMYHFHFVLVNLDTGSCETQDISTSSKLMLHNEQVHFI